MRNLSKAELKGNAEMGIKMMNDKWREAFDQIRAEEQLKDSTRAYLAAKTRGYAAMNAGGHLHRASAGAALRAHVHVYAAACACLLFMLFGGHFLYFTEAAQISIDINPSLELGVNRFDRVISVDGFNEDGRALSKTLHVKFKNYTDAVSEILANSKVEALLSRDEIMTITVTGSDETRSTRILSEVEATTAHHQNTYYYFAPSEEVAAAHNVGLSCGKYKAFLEAQTLDPNITPEAVHGMTMRELRNLIDTLSEDSGGEVPPSDTWNSGHHGYNYSTGHRGGHE